MPHRPLMIFTVGLATLFPILAAAQPFTDLAVGSTHICAITEAGETECTTSGFSNRYGAPDDLPPLIDIAAGDQHTCGIDVDGQAICWGGTGEDGTPVFGYFDQLNVPEISQPLTSIGAGANHSCAIDVNGRVWCWGLDTNQQAQPPGDGLGENGGGFIKVDGGLNHSCGIQTDGDIACWTNDSRYDAYTNVPGPFIDLDIDYFTGCGLKSDGNIDCWHSSFAPPNNGPYTDLVVSDHTICGLQENQTVDCTFGPNISTELPVFSTESAFIAIESGSKVFRPAQPFCGLTTSGEVECTSYFDSIPLPGSSATTGNSLNTVNLALTAQRYSRNQIELFWNSPPTRYDDAQILVEIYRDDVLIDTTANANSWYDPSEQIQDSVSYKVRAVDGLGNIGQFSNLVTIDNETGAVAEGSLANNLEPTTPAHTVDRVRLVRIGNLAIPQRRYAVTWAGSTPGTEGLKGYELRINNKVVAFNDGFIHRLESFNAANCNKISVAAVADDGSIIDYRTIVTNRRSNNYSSCRDDD